MTAGPGRRDLLDPGAGVALSALSVTLPRSTTPLGRVSRSLSSARGMHATGRSASPRDQPVVRCARSPLCGIVVRMLKHISLSIAIALLGSGMAQSQQTATLDLDRLPQRQGRDDRAPTSRSPPTGRNPTAARSPSSWAG